MKSGAYFDEKQKGKKRWILKLKIYSGLAAFFILIIGAGYLVVYSSVFRVARIETDKTLIDADEIINNLKFFFAGQSKIAEFLGSENILIWKQKKISEFLKKEPQIAELKIEKYYFNRLIKISVKEREKFGIWCQETRCWWFDKNGVIFSEAPSMEGGLINKINDFSSRPLELGDKILEEKFLSNLLKIFEIIEKSDLKIKSLRLEDIALQEVIADLPPLPKIYFSLRIDPSFTLAALEAMKKNGLGKIEYIDLRTENRAYYKIK